MSTASVQVGRHLVAPGVYFEVRHLDVGILLQLFDERPEVNRRYSLIYNERGDKYQEIAPIEPSLEVGSHPPVLVPPKAEPPVADPLAPRRLTTRSPTTIRLTLKFEDSKTGKVTSKYARLHAAYNLGNETILLVQIRVRNGVRDTLAWPVGGGVRVFEGRIPESKRLQNEDWDRFLELPDGATFKLGGQQWQKVPLADLGRWRGIVLCPPPPSIRDI